MRFNLPAMARRAGLRRPVVILRPIVTTTAQAKSLAGHFRRMLAPWLDARQRIEAAYADELKRVLQQDSVDDLAQLFEEIGAAVSRLVVTLTPALRSFAVGVERWHRERWLGTVLSGAGVDLTYQIGPESARETIEAFMARNVALVSDVSTQAKGRISDAVFRGLQRRTPARDVGKEIAEALGMARRRANNIAADQAVKLASALDAQRQREAGLTIWRWKHSAKLHPRQVHVERDGNLYADAKADRGALPGGEVVREPPRDLPGELPFCGCIRQAVLVIDGEVF